MTLKSDLRKQYIIAQGSRYRTFSTGYKFDKWLMQACFFIILAYLFSIVYFNDFDLDYYECRQPGFDQDQCKNPFYEPLSWKNEPYLSPGKYGTEPGVGFKLMLVFIAAVFTVGLYINHIVYNKGKKLWKFESEQEQSEEQAQ